MEIAERTLNKIKENILRRTMHKTVQIFLSDEGEKNGVYLTGRLCSLILQTTICL